MLGRHGTELIEGLEFQPFCCQRCRTTLFTINDRDDSLQLITSRAELRHRLQRRASTGHHILQKRDP